MGDNRGKKASLQTLNLDFFLNMSVGDTFQSVILFPDTKRKLSMGKLYFNLKKSWVLGF